MNVNMTGQKDKAIKIAMIDDHILIRDALASVINGFENCKVILLARHGNEFIEKIQIKELPNLVILDLNMPELDGYETAKWLQKKIPSIYILVLTMYDSEFAMIRLLQSGVRGFLKKDIHPEELRLAIETTMNTGYYYPINSATSRLMGLMKKNESKHMTIPVMLTQNELNFLKLAGTDMTYREIAKILKISPRTVDDYRDTLFEKLNVKSRVGLVMFAIKNGVITPGY